MFIEYFSLKYSYLVKLWCILFLYHFMLVRDGQCPEFNVEEQAICAVGLTISKPGVFVEAIQYLLILATPAEVIISQHCFCPLPVMLIF